MQNWSLWLSFLSVALYQTNIPLSYLAKPCSNFSLRPTNVTLYRYRNTDIVARGQYCIETLIFVNISCTDLKFAKKEIDRYAIASFSS